MSYPHVIGIAGPDGGGKTTLANALVEAYAGEATIVPFAAAVKEAAAQLGWNGQKDENGRRLLRLLGTDVCRECIHQDIWAAIWMQKALELLVQRGVQAVIADDVRFPNEVRFLRALAWVLQGSAVVIEVQGRTDYGGHASNRGLPFELLDAHWDNREERSVPVSAVEAGELRQCVLDGEFKVMTLDKWEAHQA